jgi:hypothetical protein
VEAYHRDPVAASTIPLQNSSYSVQNEVYDIAVTGVRLRPSRIKRNRGLNLWYGHHDDLTPFAQILDGPLKGREVDITDISDYYQINDSGPFMFRPIPLLVEAEQ